MIYSFELNEADQKFAEAYCEEIGKPIGEFAKECLLEHIEDIMDLRLYETAKAEYEADPVTYSLDEVESELMANAV